VLIGCRLGLDHRRRRAGVLIYREITNDYWAPLGVWVIREGTRRAMAAPPAIFDTLEQAVGRAAANSENDAWPGKSWILRERRVQRRITDFLEREASGEVPVDGPDVDVDGGLGPARRTHPIPDDGLRADGP